ncbi:hypothetical protein SAMN03097699_0537 [Flavobacteriaceae bacterium MAR_2010_188]|nr:hypothetical protein SAMN03097699_0537 [Flavobacteriaceae bacterium MAR_2010_188]
MKNLMIIVLCLFSLGIYAQQTSIQYFRPNDKTGMNVFETPKTDTIPYTGVKVRVGGDFAMQFQGLDQTNDQNNLVELGSNFNLPVANLNLDVQLIDGVRMHLTAYLSSQHHEETWVKGGHIQIDKLDFVTPGFLEGLMEYTTIRIGLDEFNYGDAHFRRTDNARAIFNPFVGNYIMDSFSTEAFGEVNIQKNGLLAVLGVTNGKLNQSVIVDDNTDNKLSIYGKLGFDKQIRPDIRFRLTGSIYSNQGTSTGGYLYGGDRAGGRYYNVLHTVADADGNTQGGDFEGRYNARFKKITAIQINPFIKLKGIEFFGIYEVASGGNEITGPVSDKEGSFTQVAGELLYRFGADERFYLGTRYNTVKGKTLESATDDLKITRFNLGGGWFLSKNIVMKLEYVNQKYKGNAWAGRFAGAEFDGFNVEAAISF